MVVVSASDRSADVIRAIDLGAMGFVPKRASNETLFEALHMVMSGGIYVPPMTMGSAKPRSQAPRATRRSVLRMAASGARQRLPTARCRSPLGLTPRQTDVLGAAAAGPAEQADRARADLSVETVKDHVAAVLRALGVSSRTQAVLAVSQMSSQGGVAPWLTRRVA